MWEVVNSTDINDTPINLIANLRSVWSIKFCCRASNRSTFLSTWSTALVNKIQLTQSFSRNLFDKIFWRASNWSTFWSTKFVDERQTGLHFGQLFVVVELAMRAIKQKFIAQKWILSKIKSSPAAKNRFS